MRSFLVCVHFVCVATVASANTAVTDAVIAEVTWVTLAPNSANDRTKSTITRQIVYRYYDGERWRDSQVVYNSKNPLVTPSIYSIKDGHKILVWSELKSSKTVLMFREFVNFQWQPPKLLSDVGIENLGASLASDSNGVLHAFWSAHQNDNDDIYQSTYRKGVWSQARRIHSRNNVPDYNPFAALDKSGNLVVSWKSYSPLLLGYDTASRTVVKANESLQKKTPYRKDDLQLSDIIAPQFLPTNALHVVHFPRNTWRKNEHIEGY